MIKNGSEALITEEHASGLIRSCKSLVYLNSSFNVWFQGLFLNQTLIDGLFINASKLDFTVLFMTDHWTLVKMNYV